MMHSPFGSVTSVTLRNATHQLSFY